MRRALLAAIVLALVLPVQSADADIAIVGLSPRHARSGDRIRATAAGYLGMTHQVFTVILVPKERAPRPRSCLGGSAICTPSFLPARLDRPPFTPVGKVTRWRQVGPRGVRQGRAGLSFRLPRVAPGRYVLGLFCPSCTRGPKGSLIIADNLILRVEG
jgi:hypothetical protein